jgi:tricorn protease
MYSDAWRMLRDYYYDPKMTGINWLEIHSRYLNLVKRCARREELDDVLKQMSSELSALHVFVYGGEYPDPFIGNYFVWAQDEVASLAASLERSSECSGYIVTNIGEFDPDFNPVDGTSVYSPLSDRTLGMTGQRGLAIGDVIIGINGENVLSVPDIFMLLRGQAGRTVRLDVVRVKSKSTFALSDSRVVAPNNTTCINQSPEPVLVVPISSEAAANVRYLAWEWKTRQQAKSLAAKAGFTVGYSHLRSMIGAEGEDSFIRGFYPDFDKDGMIIDVRHNVGGNIDSWLLTALQKKAWMYWQDRARNITTGGMGWDEQFAFRGHLVVLVDEKTSSDGEGKHSVVYCTAYLVPFSNNPTRPH